MVAFTAVSKPVVPPTVNSDAGESSDSAEVALDDSAADDDQPKSVDGDTDVDDDDIAADDDASYSSRRHAKKRAKTVAPSSSVPAGTSSYN